MTTENSADDLDLMQLLEKGYRFLQRYGLLLCCCTLIGAGLGYLSYKTLPKQYGSSLLLHSFTLTNTEQITIIGSWDQLLKDGEYDALADQLHCSPAVLKQVKSIGAAETQKLYIQNNPNGFLVEVIVTNNEVLDSLQAAIVYGLENSDYIRDKLATRREDLHQLISSVETEIGKLDSSKNTIEHSINSNTPHGGNYMIDISDINTQVISLKEKLYGYGEELKFLRGVQILHPFLKLNRPAAPKFIKSIALGLLAGFFIGYLLCLLLYIRRKIKSRASH